MQAATKWSQRWSAKARDPQVLCSWGPLPSLSCTPSDATSTRSFTTSTWPFQAATCNGIWPRAAHAAETFLAEVEERVTTETRWDRTKFTRRSPTAEAPGHRCPARPPAPWPWQAAGPPPRGRCVPHSAAGSSLSPEPVLWMCIRASTPTKLGTKLLESMFVLQVTRPFSFAACLIWIDRHWPKSTSPIIVSSLSQACRNNKSNLLNPLNSLTQSAQTYGALMRHTDTACRESRLKTCRMCSSSIFWAEGYRDMAKPCVKSMAKENEHHIITVSGDRRLASTQVA